MAADDSELLPSLFVIGNEKLLYLIEQRLIHLIKRGEVLVIVGVDRNPDQPVVRKCLAIFRLPGFDYSDQADVQKTDDVSGSSINTMTSSGSPSSARVDGMKPKSWGKESPSARTPPRPNRRDAASYRNLLRRPFGVSMIALHSRFSDSNDSAVFRDCSYAIGLHLQLNCRERLGTPCTK